MSRVNNKQAVEEMRARRVFANNNNTLIGARRFRGWGKMPLPEQIDQPETGVDYWVYSGRTPIAWVTDAGFAYVPDVELGDLAGTHQDMAEEAFGIEITDDPRPEGVEDFVAWLGKDMRTVSHVGTNTVAFRPWIKSDAESLIAAYEIGS